MARPLRIVRVGAWYHITARGNERRPIFRDDRDRFRFYELLDEVTTRFGVPIHAFVLMENHYHLLLELTQANLSRAVQWLNTSYSVWFNRRHRRSGHLLQGRFKAIIVEPRRWGLALTRYIHLNPVRVMRLGMGKRDRQRARSSGVEAPDRALVRERLDVLRRYRWSSYGAYVGAKEPKWLCVDDVLEMAGGKASERKRNYRRYVEEALRNGLNQSPWEQTTEQVVLGSQEFVRWLRKSMLPTERTLAAGARLARQPVALQTIIAAVEKDCGKKWPEFINQYGDVNRDLVLYLGRRHSGLTLADLARQAGVRSVSVASMAVQRFARKVAAKRELQKRVERLCKMLNVQGVLPKC